MIQMNGIGVLLSCGQVSSCQTNLLTDDYKPNYLKTQECYLKQANSGGESTVETGWFLFLLLLAICGVANTLIENPVFVAWGTRGQCNYTSGKQGEHLRRDRETQPQILCINSTQVSEPWTMLYWPDSRQLS